MEGKKFCEKIKGVQCNKNPGKSLMVLQMFITLFTLLAIYTKRWNEHLKSAIVSLLSCNA